MLQKFRKTIKGNSKGFTLIELMIVIAIIGILAAIAIPQFLTYRVRANNTAGESLAKQVNNSQSALNSDISAWGVFETGVVLTAVGGAAPSATTDTWGSNQAFPAATAQSAGAAITGTYYNQGGAALNVSGVGQTVPNGQDVQITLAQDGAGQENQLFQVIVEPASGNRAFGIDGNLTDVLYFVQNDDWRGLGGAIDCTVPALVNGVVGFDPAGDDTGASGGGLPTDEWHVLK